MKRTVGFIILMLFLWGCKLTPEQISTLASTTIDTVATAARPVSDEEEYYLGRAVTARILTTYPLYRNRRVTEYLNQVGVALALHSDQPTTYGGYHFAVLDSQEINAFASPGGTILITRGMLASLKSEEELAAVLAHEIGHIVHRDGVAAIQSSRWTEALTVLGSQAAKELGNQDTAKLVALFEGSIEDIFKTLVVNGYGREQERAADQEALKILVAAGYDVTGLLGYLNYLEQGGNSSRGGMFATHPGTGERIAAVQVSLQALPQGIGSALVRTNRFKEVMAALK